MLNYMLIKQRMIRSYLFAMKVRFCLFCLEHILFVDPPLKELKRDLLKVEKSSNNNIRRWALRTYQRYFPKRT